jgi:hypothetical protein
VIKPKKDEMHGGLYKTAEKYNLGQKSVWEDFNRDT